MAIHILIPTLQGLSAVQGIVREDPDVPSVVCLNGTAQSLPISNAYYDFVKKGQGVIARDFNHEAWRVDLSEPVEMGNSWQLGLYLAHYFFEMGYLGSGEPVAGDAVLWVSGAVKSNHQVEAVDGVERKLSFSIKQILDWKNKGIRTIAVMCTANHALVNLPEYMSGVEVDDVKNLGALTTQLNLRTKTKQTRHIFHWLGAGLMVFMLALGIYAFKYQQQTRLIAKPANHSVYEPTLRAKQSLRAKQPPRTNQFLALLHVKRAEIRAQCASANVRFTQFLMDDKGRFKNQSLSGLCSLGFEFEIGHAKFVIAYSINTRMMIRVQKNEGIWNLPLPKEQSKNRPIVLIVYEQVMPDEEDLSKLKRFLDFDVEHAFLNAKELTQKFKSLGWNKMQAYTLTLE